MILSMHFLSIFLYGAIGLRLFNGFSEVMAIVLSIAPLTSLYFTAFLRYVVGDDGSGDSDPTIPVRAFWVQFVVISIFGVALLPVGGWLFQSGYVKYSDISVFTGFVDTLFGAYLAVIFGSLFPENMVKRAQAGAPGA
jgi:hypothetical protein